MIITMKRSYLYLVLFFLALFGCQTEEIIEQVSGSSNRQLKAVIEGQQMNNGTRTAVDNAGNVTWIESDELGVFGTQTENANYKSTGNGADVTFTGRLDSDDEEVQWAYYPYDKDAVLDENGKLTLSLPAEYSYTGNSNAPMLGKKIAANQLSFQHLAGLVKFTLGGGIPENADRFVVKSVNEAQPIAGLVSFAVDVHPSTLEIIGNASQTVTYSLDNVTDELQYFFVPIPVGTYDALEVSFYLKDSDSPAFTRRVSNLEVSRARMISMPILNWNTGEQFKLNESTNDITVLGIEAKISQLEDKSTLKYSDVAANELPSVDDILWSKVSDGFPNGFIGKVTGVKENGDGSYSVTTVPVPLDDVFDELLIEEETDLMPISDTRAVVDASKQFYVPIVVDDEDLPYDVNAGVYMELKFLSTIHINKKKQIYRMDYSLQVGTSVAGILNFNFELDGDDFKPFSLEEFKLPPVPLAGGVVVIVPAAEAKLYLTPSGSINFETALEYRSKFIGGAEYKDGSWNYNCRMLECGEQSPWNMISPVRMNGNLFYGVGLEFKAKFYDCDQMKFYIEPKMGVNLSGELEIDPQSVNLQELYRDAYLNTNNVISCNFGVDATILHDQLEASEVYEHAFDKKKIYLLPLFEDLKAKVGKMGETASRSSNDPFEATITMTGSRELLSRYMQFTAVVANEAYPDDKVEAEWVDYQVYGGGPLSQVFTNTFQYLTSVCTYRAYPKVSGQILGESCNYEIELTDQFISFQSPVMNLRDKLVALYKATGGDNWTNNTNWCSDLPIEQWYGVSLGPEDCYNISLEDNNLSGTFVLGDPNVCYIDVSGNPNVKEINTAGCTSLERLVYDRDVVTTLDVSECDLLFNGNVNGKLVLSTILRDDLTLVSITARNCPSITQVDIERNFEKLDFAGCENLASLYIGLYSADSDDEVSHIGTLSIAGCNNLTSFVYPQLCTFDVIDVSDCIHMETLPINTGYSEVKEIYARNCTSLLSVGGPDVEVCKAQGCTNLQSYSIKGSVSQEDIEGCNNLVGLHADGILSVDLSEKTLLEQLSGCINAPLDLTNNPYLKKLTLTNNEANVTSLNLSKNRELEYLNLTMPGLVTLDLTNNRSLTQLEIWGGAFTELNLKQCTLLETIGFYRDLALEELDVALCNKLKEIDFSNGGTYHLKTLNANGCDELTKVFLTGNTNSLEADFTDCKKLTDLTLSSSHVTSLKLDRCAALEKVNCYKNDIKVLDVSDCILLKQLNVSDNPLEELNTDGLVLLEYLSCGGINMQELDITHLSSLQNFDCGSSVVSAYKTQLSSLNASGLTNLQVLDCDNSGLTELKIDGTPSLKELSCRDNAFSTLDLSGHTSIENLYCDAVSLNISGCTGLTELNVRASMKYLDISGCTNLSSLSYDALVGTIKLEQVTLNESQRLSLFAGINYCWGEHDYGKYPAPSHNSGYQYPLFVFK